MKKVLVLAALLMLYCNAFSQVIYYAAAKAGLSMREQPSTNAKVVEKIAYGEKLVTETDNSEKIAVSTEGFNGYWWKVKYNNKTGYIVSSYALPLPPPKAGIKKLTDYFAQVSSKAGAPLQIKKSDAALNEAGESELTKQLYKNGMEWHHSAGYEYGSDIYFIPDFSVEQAFLLLRLLGQYPELISDKDPFSGKNTTSKNDLGSKTVTIERENTEGRSGRINKIKISAEQGVITDFEIYLLDTQTVIYRSSGV